MSRAPAPLALLALLIGAAPPAGAQGFDRASDQPIEITADSLEVVQADRIATFVGNVDAVQGDLVLSADRLKVHYRGSGDDEPASGSTGTIRRIEATGNVVLTSPEETAEGEVGVYDVAAQLVTLDGAVVLTRGENVIRGDRLELDLATGVSRVVANATAAEGAPPERRVRAVFTPNEGEGQKAEQAEKVGKGRRTSGGGRNEAEPEAGSGRSPEGPEPGAAAGRSGRVPVPVVKPGDDG